MQCNKPITIKCKKVGAVGIYEDLQVPCGKCIACRIAKRKEWSLRCLHELTYWDRSSFITLTYSEPNLPDWASLRKRDLQLFIKRLRRNMGKNNSIKYFACGEYGDTNYRPHYHAIIFGLGLNDDDKQLVIDSWPYCDWDNKDIRKNSFGLAEPNSIQYVCQYIDKKYTGELEQEIYTDSGRETPFRLLSKGIGERYAKDNVEQIKQLGYISRLGVKNSIPRYYIKKLELDVNEITQNAYYNECEENEKYCGINISTEDALKTMNPDIINQIYEGRIKTNKQSELNLTTKINLRKKKL